MLFWDAQKGRSCGENRGLRYGRGLARADMGMDMGIISRNAANVVAAAAGLLILAVSARAADMTLRFSSAAPPSDFLAKSIELFKAEVEKANAGLKVDSYPAS